MALSVARPFHTRGAQASLLVEVLRADCATSTLPFATWTPSASWSTESAGEFSLPLVHPALRFLCNVGPLKTFLYVVLQLLRRGVVGSIFRNVI